jgi:hypothetical protein
MNDAVSIEPAAHAVGRPQTAAPRLLEAIDPHVSLVLIGEATHGTLSSIGFAPIHARPHPTTGVQHRRRRGRLAGCVPGEPVGSATRDRQHR